MTRHLLLPTTARRRPGGGGPVDPGPTDPIDPTGPTKPDLTATDPITMRLRPALPATDTYVIASDGTGHFATFEQAYAAIPSATGRAIRMAINNLSAPDATCRIDFLVKPGTYDGGSGPPGPSEHTAFYATDPTPGSTRLEWGQENWGGSIYWEGIDLINPSWVPGFDPKYAWHIHGGGAITFARCLMRNDASKSGGAGIPVGMDGVPDSTLCFHNVRMPTGAWTNLHGWANWTAGPGMDTIFSAVTMPDVVAYYNAMQDVTTDALWVLNASSIGGAGIRGAATSLHIAPDTTIGNLVSYTGHQPVTSGATMTGTNDQRTDAPMPWGGLTPAQRAQYGVTA